MAKYFLERPRFDEETGFWQLIYAILSLTGLQLMFNFKLAVPHR